MHKKYHRESEVSVAFHFERNGNFACVSDGVFTYENMNSAQDAINNMKKNPMFSNIRFVSKVLDPSLISKHYE